MTPTPLRMVQIGLGNWGRSWANGVLPHVGEVEVVAAVDPDPAAGCFATLDEALASGGGAQAALITSSMASHAQVALAALRAGLHVLVEKPFAPTLAEAALVVREARERGLVLAVAQNYRYFTSMLTLTALVQGGRLGPAARARVDFRKNHPGHGVNELDDHVLTQLSIHHFDLMRAVFGQEPVGVFCRAWSPKWTAQCAPASAAAVIDFDGGLVVSYSASRESTGPQTAWEGEWVIECEGGQISLAANEVTVLPLDGEPRVVPIGPTVRERATLLSAFAAAIRDGGPPPNPGWDNLRSVALLDAARRSAATGEHVDLDGSFLEPE